MTDALRQVRKVDQIPALHMPTDIYMLWLEMRVQAINKTMRGAQFRHLSRDEVKIGFVVLSNMNTLRLPC